MRLVIYILFLQWFFTCNTDHNQGKYKVNLSKVNGLNWDIYFDSSSFGIPRVLLNPIWNHGYVGNLFYKVDKYPDFKMTIDFDSVSKYNYFDLTRLMEAILLKPNPANKVLNSISSSTYSKYTIFIVQDTVSLKYSYIGEYSNIGEKWSVSLRLENSPLFDSIKSMRKLLYYLENIHVDKLDLEAL